MKNPTILRAENKNGFSFTFQIEKSVVKAEDNDLILSGVASTTNIDHDNERMDAAALKRMVNIVNTKGVPLRWEHSKDPSAVLGNVFKGHVDERGQMHISARLDKKHPLAKELHEAVKNGDRYGLSVGGKILNAIKEMAESSGKYVNTFYDVLLDEVSVTKKPANYDAWLTTALSKNRNADKSYNRFLFENQQFDYLAQLAKSIPEGAWREGKKLKVNKINKNMNENKDKKDGVKDEAEKSFVSKAQFDQFSTEMTKAITGIAALLKEMGPKAKDTTNPEKDKQEVETQQTAKAREGQEDQGDNGTEGDSKKESGPNAHDQESPDKEKEKEVGDSQTAKAEHDEEDGEEHAEKHDGEDGEEDHEEKSGEDMKDEHDAAKHEGEDGKEEDGIDKAEDEEKDKDGKGVAQNLKGAMKSIGDAIKVIDNLTKKMKGVKQIVKSEKTVKKSNISEIDQFAIAVANYVDTVQERLEKSNKSIPGYTQALVAQIHADPVLQAEIRKMMKEPGLKKSIVFGSPYMVTKDGKRYSLTATPAEESVKKSQYNKGNEKGINFKDLYKSKYSAIREAGITE